jgi:hypothetical protein
MPVHPIRVPRDAYRGSNPRRLRKRQEFNELAQMLESYINDTFAKSGETGTVFIYANIAQKFNLTTEQVRDVLFAVDGGHNGITVTRPTQQDR